MCLLTRFPRIKTKKDIEVYKVLKDDLTSPFQGYQYSFNSLIESDLKALSVRQPYLSDAYVKDILPSEIVTEPTITVFGYPIVPISSINLHIQFIGEGLHSYRNIYNAIMSKPSEYIVCKAIIPAGSYIYINYNEIVSDKLIIKERVL